MMSSLQYFDRFIVYLPQTVFLCFQRSGTVEIWGPSLHLFSRFIQNNDQLVKTVTTLKNAINDKKQHTVLMF